MRLSDRFSVRRAMTHSQKSVKVALRKSISTLANISLIATLVPAFLVVNLESAAAAETVTRNIGTGSVTWTMSDFLINEVQTSEPTGTTYAGAGHGDAYDNMHYVEISTTTTGTATPITGTWASFTGVGSWNATTSLYTAPSELSLSGLRVNVSHKISATHAAGRALVTLYNNSTQAVTRTIRYWGNLGSDGGTYVKYTNKSANRTPTAQSPSTYSTPVNDIYWMTTSDNSTTDPTSRGSDPIVSYVYGTPNAGVTPSYAMSGDYTYTTWNVTVPAQSTRIIMVAYGVGEINSTLNSLGGAYDGVKNHLETFDKLPADLRSDLTAEQTGQIVNWLIAPQPTNFSAGTDWHVPSANSTLDYTVEFPSAVTGLALNDFTLGGTSTGWTLSSVTPVNSSRYTLRLTATNPTDGTVFPTIRVNAVTETATSKTGPTQALNGTTVTVDGAAPTVATVTKPADGTYWSSQNLDFTLNFNEIVNVVGTPRLPLTIGSTTRYANYVSGSGSSALLFRYSVQANSGDIDGDGIQIASQVDLNSGTIKDRAGNNFALTHGLANASLTNVKVAQTPAAPTISSIVSGNARLIVNFTPGATNGATLTTYQYTTNGGSIWKDRTDGGGVTSPLEITVPSNATTPLVNGTSYTVAIRAKADAPNFYTGAATPTQVVVPAVKASKPLNLGGTAGDQSISYIWNAPSSDGGASITRYDVFRYNPTSTNLISSYQFNDAIEDVAGSNEPTNSPTMTYSTDRVEGGKSASFTGTQVIKAPRTFTGNYSISLWLKTSTTGASGTTWNAGSALIESDVVANTSDWGLTLNGSVLSYGTTTSAGDFTIKGTTSVVDGQWHHILVQRNQTTGLVNVYLDGALEVSGTGPTTALPATGELSIARSLSDTRGFTGLLDDVRIYSAAISDSDLYSTLCFTTGATSCTATGLTNGTGYTARVNATNSAGMSAGSLPVLLTTPRGVPGAPTITGTTSGVGTIQVAFSAPTNINGSAITSYQVSTTSGASATGTTSPITLTGLTNGTTYTITVRAQNAAGYGASSTSVTASPQGSPNTPTGLALDVGDAQLTARWNAPGSNGSPITDYRIEYSTNNSTWTVVNDGVAIVTSTTITGLTNGTLYYVRVSAINAIGTSVVSGSVTATPARVPNAPTSVTATYGGTAGSVQVSWSAPTSNGGNAISDYYVVYSSNNGGTWWTFADGVSTNTSATVTGLSSGTTYLFRITAINSRGQSEYSTSSNSVIVASVPGLPTSLASTPGDTTVTLTWTAPTNNGGSAITGYRITNWINSNWVVIATNTGSSTTSYTATGLTNGTSYYFKVAAINGAGTGADTAYVGPVTPRGVPTSPAIASLSAGNQQIVVNFIAPNNNGGSTVTSYVATATDSANNSKSCTWTSGALNCTIAGLTNGTSYSVTIVARNAYGSSVASATASATPRTTATAPVFAASGATPAPVAASGTQIVLNWSAPTSNGGDAITDYVVQYSINNSTWTTFTDGVSANTTATITNLVPGTVYYLRVAAVNIAGTGAYGSPQVNPTTLQGVPDAPTSVTATAGNGSASLSWIAPNNRGSAITDYVVEYSSDSGSTWSTFSDGTSTAISTQVTGLANGTSYIFRVTAVNGIGSSVTSAASSSITTATTPSAPTVTTSAIVGNAQLQVAFTAGANGGSAITGYEYSLNGGLTWAATSAGISSPVTITGLTNGTEYTIKLRAINAVGSGTASIASAVGTPATTPGAVSNAVATPGNQSISLSFAAPTNNGGAAITGYKYRIRTSAGTFGAWSSLFTTSPISITSLTNGTQYVLELIAINSRGDGSPTTLNAMPFTVPAAPTVTNGAVGNAQLSYSITAGSTNGSVITSYEYQLCGLGSTPSTGVTLVLTNGKCVLTFAGPTSKNDTTSLSANYIWTVPSHITEMGILAVGGGGGGGQDGGSGGGGGEIRQSTSQSIAAGKRVTITVGAGGEGGTWRSVPPTSSAASAGGSATTLSWDNAEQYRANPGNGGGGWGFNSITPGATGGSGGSGGLGTPGGTGGTGPGVCPTGGTLGGVGANGGSSTISGSSQMYGGGGGGGMGIPDQNVGTGFLGAAGGQGGGGRGANYKIAVNDVTAIDGASTGHSGTDGLGGGGGGGSACNAYAPMASGIDGYYQRTDGGAGGSGVVVINYPAQSFVIPVTSSFSVTSLENGNSYLIAARAINAAGGSAYSATTSLLTPQTTPSRPQITSITPNPTSVAFTFTLNNGGSALTDVQYSVRAATNSNDVISASGTCAAGYANLTWNSYGSWTSFAAPGTSGAITSGTVSGLTSGVCYDIRIRGVNANGAGAESRDSARPLAPASAPTILSATTGDGQIIITFDEPADNGGTAITGYQYSLNSGAWTSMSALLNPNFVVNTSNSFVIGSLTNGESYTVRIRALNSSGANSATAEGAASNASAALTPAGLPLAPSLGAVTALDAAASVVINSPSLLQSGGVSLTDYEYKVGAGGAWVRVGVSSTLTISGLTNPSPRPGTATTIYVRGVNALGVGAESSFSVTPGVVPAAPTISQLIAGNGQIQVVLTPGTDGGYPITNYIYQIAGVTGTYSDDDDFVSSNPYFTFTNLVNGDQYNIRVKAVNAVGQSTLSSVSSATPATTPGAPVINVVSVGSQFISIKFTPPTFLEANSPFTPCAQGGPCAIGDLGPGGGRVFYVAPSKQSWGQILEVAPKLWSSGSEPSATWCTGGTNPTTTFISGTKSGLGAGASNSAKIASACSGGAAVLARAYNGGGLTDWYLPSSAELTELYSAKSNATISASLDGDFYWSSSEGNNWIGASLNNVSGGTGGNNKSDSLKVRPVRAFNYPTDNGGSSTTGYQYSLNDGLTWNNTSAVNNEITLSGLTNGASYTVRIRALNALGAGAASDSVSAVPQASGVGAPEDVSAISGDSSITVNWSAPSNYVGVPITGYRVTNISTGAEATVNGSTFTSTFTGLNNGTSYSFKVTATYDNGGSDIATSTSTSATPRTTPGAPSALSVTPGTGRFDLTWSAPAATGGAAITDYRIEYSIDLQLDNSFTWATYVDAVSTNTNATVTGLTPGTNYKFRVRAINSAGEGATVETANFAVTYNQAPPLTLFFGEQTATGYTFRIEMMEGATNRFGDYDALTDGFQISTTAGTITRVGEVVTVTGLTNGASADVTVTTNRATYAPTSATVTGSALITGTDPVITNVTSTDSGFTFSITDYATRISAGTTFDFVATNSARVIDNQDGTVRVEGLTGGLASTITVTALRGGYTTRSTSVLSQSLATGTAPVITNVTSAKNSFTFDIDNFDNTSTYAFTSTSGTATRVGARVTVSGLTASASATTTVVVSKSGFVNATSQTTGTALPPGSDVTLANLASNAGVINFLPSTGIYNLTVPFETLTATLTATINDTDGTLELSTDSGTSWNSYTSGSETSPINLNVGVNRFEIRVTAPNNATRIYVLSISRLPSTNPKLSGLSFATGTLSPSFNINTTNYSMTIANGDAPISFTAVVAQSGATLEYSINGATYVAMTTAVATTGVPLHVGNNELRIRGTAPDGVTTLIYSVAIKREASTTAILTGLTPSSGSITNFNSQIFDYSFAVGNTDDAITFTPTSASGAVTTVNGVIVQPGASSLPISLNVGSNTITVVVEEIQNGSAVHTTTYTFTVTRDPLPSVLEVAGVPTTTSGGALLSTSPVVTLKSGGNILTRSSNIVTVTVSDGASLSGTTSVAAINGVATFTNLRVIGPIDSDYTLTFSVAGGASVTSSQFELTPGEPTALLLLYPTVNTTPLTCGGGASCRVADTPQGDSPYPRFELRDVSGNIVGAAGRTLTATITGGAGGTISAGGTEVGVSGTTIIFDELRLRGSSANTYTLSFGGTGISPIALSANITSGEPASIALTRNAAGIRSGVNFTTAPQITIYDSEDNVVSNAQMSITATITNGVGGSLVGTSSVTPINGVATFANLALRGVAGTAYTITFTTTGLNPVTQVITPTPGPASQVFLITNPVGTRTGSTFTTQPVLQLRDSAGNLVATDNSTAVTVAVSGDARILGTSLTQPPVANAGVVEFTDLGLLGIPNVPLTLTFSVAGLTPATYTVTLLEGLALIPTFAAATRTEEGFEVQIQNYSPLYAWGVSGTNGASVSISKTGKIFVTNLSAGESSTLTVTTQRPYFATGSETFTSSALTAGIEAVLTYSAANSTSTGFSVTVTNYADLSTFEWDITASRGSASAAPNGSGVITISNLAAGEESVITVRTKLTGSHGIAVSEVTGAANGTLVAGAATADLAAAGTNLLTGKTIIPICVNGVVPSDVASSINDGVSSTNFTCYTSTTRRAAGYARNSIGFAVGDMNSVILEGIRFVRGTGSQSNVPMTYSLQGCTAQNAGCSTIITSGQTQLFGIAANADAATRTANTQVIRANRPFPFYRLTFTTLAASVTNAAQIGEVIFLGRNVINPAYAPTFGAITKSRNGFTVPISNYNTSFMWRASVPAGMTAVISSTGVIRVSGVSPGASAQLTVTTSRTGFTSGSASITGASLSAALVPIFDEPVTSANGFSVAITNYDSNYTWNVVSSAGTASIAAGTITVTNVPVATSASITVTTSRTDYATGTAQISATSTQTGITPTLSAATPNTGGFTTSITNFATGYSYSASTDVGTATLGALGAITVTGLQPGASAILTVTATRSGYSTTSTTLTGTAALGSAYIPQIGTVISNAGGFSATIANYDSAYTWSAVPVTTGPTISISGEVITVTGISTGSAANIIVTAERSGYAPGTTEFSGVAIAPVVVSLGNQDLTFTVDLSTNNSTVAPQARIDIPALAASENTEFTVRASATEQADAGYSTVQIAANGGTTSITTVNAPIVIRLPSVASDGIPAFSSDGVTWVRIPQLTSLELSNTQEMGYFLHEDGSVTILTRRIG